MTFLSLTASRSQELRERGNDGIILVVKSQKVLEF